MHIGSLQSVTPEVEEDANSDKYRLLTQKYEQVETHFDARYHALWCTLKSSSSPFFTLELLNNIRAAQDAIAELCHKENCVPKYIIWKADNPKIFSLGLDIGHISRLITAKDVSGLDNYLQLCIDVFYINLMKLDIKPMVTISLIRGKTYGGGLEAALSSDVIFAEEGAECCFPEMRYNLLPSLGTLAMLMRRFNNNELISHLFEGKQLPLEVLNRTGVIEKVVPHSHGQEAIYEYIKSMHHKHRVYSYFFCEKSKSTMISYNELEEFKKSWLDAALHLSDKDIKRLNKLAYIQSQARI
jgi:DSF synthase